MVAVVVEENDFTAEFGVQPPGGPDFGEQEAPREKSARLLAETNDGSRAHEPDDAEAGLPVDPKAAWIIKLNSTQTTQPIKLYQR